MDISVIIVNWNSFELLLKCLRSIYGIETIVKYEIIVIDNYSTEREIENLNQYFKDVKLILNNNNGGFAKANNIASGYAKGDVLLFLNPDTLLKDNLLDEMYEILIKINEKVGIVGPKILNIDGSIQKEAARYLPSVFSMFCNIFLLKRVFKNVGIFSEYISNYSVSQEVEFISGACLAIRKTLFLKIGGFSEDYFMYSEDDDICYKVIKMGLKNYYLASHEILHIGSACSKKTYNSKMFECWFFKSRRLYFRNKSLLNFLILNVIYVLGSLFRITLASLILIYKVVLRCKKDEINYYKAVVKKYAEILLLGLGYDAKG
ncbi:MAG: glycosyltransferase family 2 protein [Dehalococcoidales bacterium]|jgi:hypothetical protein